MFKYYLYWIEVPKTKRFNWGSAFVTLSSTKILNSSFVIIQSFKVRFTNKQTYVTYKIS